MRLWAFVAVWCFGIGLCCIVGVIVPLTRQNAIDLLWGVSLIAVAGSVFAKWWEDYS